MALVVTGVGALIHIYAGRYMHGEQNFQRFFVYLNFFILAMLVLILSNNFVGMFVGWEGVGLASYLLIGFYFDRHDESYGHYADAGKKAFLVNRVGDFGMMLAVFLLWTGVGSVVFEEVFAGASGLTTGAATAICLLLLLAATGKSAQLPLFVLAARRYGWPDAGFGANPCGDDGDGGHLHDRTYARPVGACAFGWQSRGLGGCSNRAAGGFDRADPGGSEKDPGLFNDISTGLHDVGVGVGAYAFAIFHLVTHAFFKALLFLAAGNVMHGLPDGELDIRKMGNLRAKMPTTFLLFAIGASALAGLPLLSGFSLKMEFCCMSPITTSFSI